MSFAERRKSPRFAVRQVLELGFGAAKVVWADVLDMSATGLLCRTSAPIERGTRVILSMVLPNGSRMECEGIGIRTNGGDENRTVAIRFTSFHGSPEGLNEYLAYLVRKSLYTEHKFGTGSRETRRGSSRTIDGTIEISQDRIF
jgi:PilZ domain